MARLPVGVIGVGALGRHHARHLARSADAALVGVHDLDPARGREVADACGARFYPDLDPLLAEVEAVTVAVPTPAHAEIGLRALERGRAVLMEKPLAATLEEADGLVRAAERRGIPLQVGHVERFNRAVRAARPHLGGARYIESDRLAPFQPRGTDVAVVLDLMIHDLDLILHLTGGAEAIDVRASGVAVLSPHLDMANARVEFASGAVANVTASRIARERVRRIRIFQPNGYLSLDLASGVGEFMRLRHGWREAGVAGLPELVERIPLDVPADDALRLELESFVRAVRGGTETVVTGAEGRAALALALRVTEAVHRAPAPFPGL
ncbi:MAG TPA: Gfo/Idh/MocA family oxidoreductase [Gemmatimonadales bacterium]|jgi:predicted dehydrogenase|nr:Gfo/Idh/MocA family oxidoreductase [Gemmatimonadales bacterium]